MRANLTAIHILNSENPTHAAGSRARTGTLSLSLSLEREPPLVAVLLASLFGQTASLRPASLAMLLNC